MMVDEWAGRRTQPTATGHLVQTIFRVIGPGRRSFATRQFDPDGVRAGAND